MSKTNSPSDQFVEARARVETQNGPLEVVARCRADRWRITAACAGRTGHGVGDHLGIALISALELCGVDAEEVQR